MRDLIEHAASGSHLSPSQVEAAVAFLLSPAVEDATKGAFLETLRAKGETAEEMASFVQAFLRRAVDPGIAPEELPGPLLDVCGTGGDRMDFFNVSTTAMFVLAAGGAVVVKHGNRGITSRCGGADVLEELGVRIDLPPAALRETLLRTGIGFLFAPSHHPSFKIIAPVRKALAARGVATIFNLLGPLLNPARPPFQLVGVYARALLPAFAEAFALLRRECAWVVHGSTGATGGGIDEISTLGPTDVRRVTAAGVDTFLLTPEEFGLSHAVAEDLRGGDRQENAAILTGVLEGSIRGPKRDVVLFNAAAGFVITGLASTVQEGLERSRLQIDNGSAYEKLRQLQAAV